MNMENSLRVVLIFLAAAVLVVILFRQFKLPAMLGYLLVGLLIGPHGLALIPDNENTRDLAEFGVVFLMFSIGLEFSLSKLMTMRRIVFGLGATQVVLTLCVVTALMVFAGVGWRAGVVLGGALAMSSTAIVSKILADRLELNSVHGRQVIGVLLFQDLAVVPLLILIPALAGAPSTPVQRRERRAGGVVAAHGELRASIIGIGAAAKFVGVQQVIDHGILTARTMHLSF